MPNDFQPEKPHASAPGPERGPAAVWIALLSALGVVMVLAIIAPRLFAEWEAGWPVALGAGVVVFVAVWVVGRMKGAQSRQPVWRGDDEGEK